jgi:hypothetical protein
MRINGDARIEALHPEVVIGLARTHFARIEPLWGRGLQAG